MTSILDANPYSAALQVLDKLMEDGQVSYDNNDFYGRFDAFKAAFLEGNTLGEACKAMLEVLPELSEDVQETALNLFSFNLNFPAPDATPLSPTKFGIIKPVKALASAVFS